ncbi:MAG: class I SAM-dependent methyltransferase, partial [Synergistaceae bacterium]|nr:class I SAM-dependent methyltransferase [Synergistaceae bacterium]
MKDEILEKIMKYNNIDDVVYCNGKFRSLHSEKHFSFYNFASENLSYNWDSELENIIDEIDSPHPIDFYERLSVTNYIRSFLEATSDKVVCDFGCSAGYMLKEIKNVNDNAVLLGVDVEESGLSKLNATDPDIMLFKFDITAIPFPDEILDVVICLNVLEHIENDVDVLGEFSRVLKNEGIVCIVVPYNPSLYDYYDEACKHVRRYAKNELIHKMMKNGFDVINYNYIGCTAYIPFYIKKKISNFFHNSRRSVDKMKDDNEKTKNSALLWKIFELDYQ